MGAGSSAEDVPSAAVPVTVVGGYLGVGKTTLVNHLLQHPEGRRLGVIVNDFGSINVDAELVVGVDGDLVQLSNGCICCTMRDDLLEGLHRLLDCANPPEHVIVEASGVSDPRSIAATLERGASRDWAALDAVVVLVDVERHLELGRRERIVAGGQIVAADILVLNKVDLVDDDTLAALEAKLRKQSRSGRVLRATHGRVPPALVLGVGAFDAARLDEAAPMQVHVHELSDQEPPHADHGHDLWTWSFRSARPLSARRLRRAVDNLPGTVVRAKGIVHLATHPGRRAVMHVVGRRAELCLDEPWGDEPPTTGLVLIGTGDPLPPPRLEEMFRGCEVGPDEGGPGGAVMRWMRRVLPTRERSSTG